jgi:predicted double-glycine peptidase
MRFTTLFLFFLVLAIGDGVAYARPIESYRAAKFKNLVKQKLEFSCGAASLATILTYYWGRPTQEAEILELVEPRYTGALREELKNEGMSADDIAYAAVRLKFQAVPLAVAPQELKNLKAPVIIHTKRGKLEHFSVLKYVDNGRYLLADSIVGNRILNEKEFNIQYSGFIIVVGKHQADLPGDALLSKKNQNADPRVSLSTSLGWGWDRISPGFR